MHPVRLTKLPEADVEAAFQRYEREKTDIGLEFLNRVDEAIERIAKKSSIHAPLIKNARRVLLKQFPFALWYVLVDDGSVAIGCLHGRRDMSVAKSRLEGKPQV